MSIWASIQKHSRRLSLKRGLIKKNEASADRSARLTAEATVWLAIFTVVLACTSLASWLVLWRQLDEMRSGGIDTHNLADAAKRQQVATEQLAKAAQLQAVRTDDLAHRMREQAEETKIVAAQAEIQAKAARDSAMTSRSALQDSQRPWVGVQGPIEILEPPKFSFENGKERGDLKVSLWIRNVGTTPALNVTTSVTKSDMRTSNEADWLAVRRDEMKRLCSLSENMARSDSQYARGARGVVRLKGIRNGTYLFPGESSKAEINIGLPEISQREDVVRIVGCVVYNDEFSIIHHTTFCFRGQDTLRKSGPATNFATCNVNQNTD